MLLKGKRDLKEIIRKNSLRRRFEATLEDKERDLEITRESYAKIQQKKTMLEEEKLRAERKIDIIAQDFEEREREYRKEAGVLLERMNMLNEGIGQLKEENRKVNNDLKVQEEDNRKYNREIKILGEKNDELAILLDESQREKERLKNNMMELLEQNKEIKKKEEEIMKHKIKEQEYLSQVF